MVLCQGPSLRTGHWPPLPRDINRPNISVNETYSLTLLGNMAGDRVMGLGQRGGCGSGGAGGGVAGRLCAIHLL
jgi:hypothetical protein